MFKSQIIDKYLLTKYFIKETKNISKNYISLLVVNSLLKAISPLVLIIMPKFIIDELLSFQRIDVLLKLIVFTVATNFILSFISNFLEKKLYVMNEKINIWFENRIGNKSMEIDFENVEDPDVLKLKESAIFAISSQKSIIVMIETISSIISNIFSIVSVVVLISTLNVMLVCLILVVVFINSLNYKKTQEVQYKSNQEVIEVNRQFSYFSRLTLDFSMAKDIRLLNMKSFLMEKIRSTNKDMYNKVNLMFKKIYRITAKNFINLEIQNLLTYLYLIYSVFKLRIGIGSFTMYLSATQNLSSSISNIVNDFIMLNQVYKYLNDYKEFEDIKIKEKSSGEIILSEIESIEFKNVSFVYPKRESYSLTDINIRIAKGEKLSIVGMNGAGKTTFIKLLARLYEPTHGEILINDINIKEYNYESYINQLSIVFQDFKLFAFSVKENICFDKDNKTNSNIIKDILNKLNLGKVIENLELDIDTPVYRYFDEKGIEFSGGQSQKIAIARALYKDANMLILDEPTAALDPASEDEIYRNFHEITEGKISIFISHRLSSCRLCDKIAVFDNGKIIQYGNHDTLYKEKESKYEEMYSLQAENYSY